MLMNICHVYLTVCCSLHVWEKRLFCHNLWELLFGYVLIDFLVIILPYSRPLFYGSIPLSNYVCLSVRFNCVIMHCAYYGVDLNLFGSTHLGMCPTVCLDAS